MWPTLKAVIGSFGSYPAMASSMRAQSATLRVRGPILSCVTERGTIPSRLISPAVGRIPTRLFAEEGERIEPPVSEPVPTAAKFAATAAAVPPDEPPGVLVKSWGFLGWLPNALLGIPPP